MATKYSYESQPCVSMVRDQRSDSEILSQLQTFQPVTDSEKNVWAFWDKGLLNSPPWNQRNVISWVRRLGPEWTVRVLDRVEASPVHISLFVDAKDFPEAFNENTMTGPHIGPHTADLIRLPLLYRYGGVWLDVGFMLFRHLDDICWNTLADPDTSFEMAGFKVTFDARTSMIFNGFIAAKRGNPCIKYWHDIFLKCWEGTTTTEGMHKHPLLAHLPKYEPPGANPFFTYAQFVDYMAQVFCLERLRNLEDPSADWDGPEYFEKKILLFDCGKEIYWAMRMTMWDGRRQFNLLATAKEGNVNRSEQAYRDAEAFVEGILQNSSTLKLSHGLVIPGREYLATIWDQKENHDADVKEGTWAAYLRWASENYCASWKMARVKMPPIEEARQVGGILEVVGNSPA